MKNQRGKCMELEEISAFVKNRMTEGLISWSALVAFHHTDRRQPHFIGSQTITEKAITYSMPCDLAPATHTGSRSFTSNLVNNFSPVACPSNFYLYQRMHLFLSYTKIT